MAIAEVINSNPKISLGVISFLVTLVSTFIHKWMTNQEHMKNLKDRQKEIQKELRKQKDPEILKELNAEMLKLTGTMMKSSFRPMFVTILPFLILFSWLRSAYSGILSGWIWWYIGYSIVFSSLIRKIFKIQ